MDGYFRISDRVGLVFAGVWLGVRSASFRVLRRKTNNIIHLPVPHLRVVHAIVAERPFVLPHSLYHGAKYVNTLSYHRLDLRGTRNSGGTNGQSSSFLVPRCKYLKHLRISCSYRE